MVLLITSLLIKTEDSLKNILGRDVDIAPHTTVDATYTYSWDDF